MSSGLCSSLPAHILARRLSGFLEIPDDPEEALVTRAEVEHVEELLDSGPDSDGPAFRLILHFAFCTLMPRIVRGSATQESDYRFDPRKSVRNRSISLAMGGLG
jgi:hypothetical protein